MSGKIDIVLVKPGSQKKLYGELSSVGLTGLEPPLWGALLAAYLREAGYLVALFDAEVEGWGYDETALKIKEIDPVLAVVFVSGTNPSASTMNMTGAGEILSCVRGLSPETKTLIMGLHPSALPKRTMEDEDVDFLCVGEGFYTLPLLIDALKAKDQNLDIKGLWKRVDGRIVPSEIPELIEDLGVLPIPAWDLLPMERYRAHNWHCFNDIENRSPYGVIYTSLGCPFKCSFCCINALFGASRIRYRPLESVFDELDLLVNKYGIKHLKIVDEMFVLNEERVVQFSEGIVKRGYDLNIWAYARVNTVTEKMLSKMKEAGINWLAYGFESGSEKVIKDVSKGYKTELVAKVVDMTRDAGINICANYIFGLPEDDYASMNETLKLMLDINAEWANIYSAMAYPGSELYDDAIKEGWPLPDSWQDFSQYSYEALPLATRHLKGSQVLAFRDYAFNAYFSNPAYLNMIGEKFGAKIVEHIITMAAKKLKRKNVSY